MVSSDHRMHGPNATRGLPIAAFALMLAACAAPATRVETVPAPDYNGQAHHQQIPDPVDSARYRLEPGQSVELPALQRNPDPIYPPELVALNLGKVTLVARLSVDAEGKVSATWVSEYHGDEAHRPRFELAVREAASTWQFRPMVIFDDTQADERGQAKPFSTWFKFQFDVIDGQANASSGQTASQ